MKYTISVLMSPATSAVWLVRGNPHLTSFAMNLAIQFGDERWRFTLASADSAQDFQPIISPLPANAPPYGEWWIAIAKSHVITSYATEGGLLPLRYTNNFASGNFFLLEQTVFLSNTGLDWALSKYFKSPRNPKSLQRRMKLFSQLLVLGLAAEVTIASNWFSKAGMSSALATSLSYSFPM